MSDSLRPHGLEHARLPCPPLSPGVCSNSCLLHPWCHPTILFSVALFTSCSQFFQASGSFSISELFPSGGQSIGASASVLLGLISFRIDWFDLLEGLSRVFSSTTIQRHRFSSAQPSLWSNFHIYMWLLKKKHSFYLYGPLPTKWCLCFVILCLGLS